MCCKRYDPRTGRRRYRRKQKYCKTWKIKANHKCAFHCDKRRSAHARAPSIRFELHDAMSHLVDLCVVSVRRGECELIIYLLTRSNCTRESQHTHTQESVLLGSRSAYSCKTGLSIGLDCMRSIKMSVGVEMVISRNEKNEVSSPSPMMEATTTTVR